MFNNKKLEIMKKVLINDGKNISILSNGGRYNLMAKMKVDYDAVNNIFGARDWYFRVFDLNTNKGVTLQEKGQNVFKYNKYQYKKELIKAIELVPCFSDAMLELKNKI